MSRSPKSNKLLILSDLYRLANLVTFHPMVHEITCRQTFWLNFGGLSLKWPWKNLSSFLSCPNVIFMQIWSKSASWFMKSMHTCTFWLKFGSLSPALNLKNRSRSSKSNQLFIMSQCYIHANLTISWDMVHTSTFRLKFGSLSPVVTLKIRSRSPKPNQLFIMSQCYIHANLIKIHPPVHEISCKQKSVTPTLTPTLTGSAPKTICPPPLRWGT